MDNLEYDKMGRLKYNESLHFNHGKPFTEDDLMYICKFWDKESTRSLSLSVGKTEMTLANRVATLKRDGLYQSYIDKYDRMMGD